MTPPRSVLGLLLVALVALGAWLALTLRPSPGRRSGTLEPTLAAAPEETVLQPPPVELVGPPRLPEGVDEDTTVLWPLEVELELVRADYLPTAEGVAPIGSGRTARLAGQIGGLGEEGVTADVRFIAGPNEGVVLRTDASGRFGSTTLFPGLSIVSIEGPGLPGSRREVRLRQGKETLLNLGYGRLASVFGKVIDRANEPIAGATVDFDGRRVVTNEEGAFYVDQVAGGPCLVEIEHEGYALFRDLVNVTSGAVIDPGRVQLVLEPAASMEIFVLGNVGGPGPVLLNVLPAQPNDPQRNFPWHRINPVEVYPGQGLRIDGLPSKVVKLLAFRPGAEFPQKIVNLRAGQTLPVELEARPAEEVSGRVLLDGEPLPGAVVRFEAPDQVRATLGYLREPSYYLESEVFPMLAPAFQEVTTDSNGRFRFTAYADVVPSPLVTALGPSGTRAARLLRPGEDDVVLELKHFEAGDATLILTLSQRWQGLPVEVMANGMPFDPRVIPHDRNLEIDDLVAGTWRIRARWYTTTVLEERTVEVRDVTRVPILLPPEAVEGQDEEAWHRAGREYPNQ